MAQIKGSVHHAEIVDRLRDKISSGLIQPGERIQEAELCAEFGVSRTPLREALKVLASHGLASLSTNRGARVTVITPALARELFEVIASLESLAGELACRQISASSVACLRGFQDSMEKAYAERDVAAYYAYNKKIHEGIVAASGNSVLKDLYISVSARLQTLRYSSPLKEAHWELALREHSAMQNALERRDGEVLGSILRTHLRHKREAVLENLNAKLKGLFSK